MTRSMIFHDFSIQPGTSRNLRGWLARTAARSSGYWWIGFTTWICPNKGRAAADLWISMVFPIIPPFSLMISNDIYDLFHYFLSYFWKMIFQTKLRYSVRLWVFSAEINPLTIQYPIFHGSTMFQNTTVDEKHHHVLQIVIFFNWTWLFTKWWLKWTSWTVKSPWKSPFDDVI